jgi:hypothetical protein
MSSTPLRNLSRRTKVYWKEYEHWACGRHLPALVLPANIEQCWLCSNKRPPMEDRPPMPEGFEAKKTKPKTKNAPKRMVIRRQPSELDAMLTGSVSADLDAEMEAKPATRPVRKAVKNPAAVAKTAKAETPKATAIAPKGLVDGHVCAWDGCNEIARPRSKYCSRNCSNKNARARHKARVK